MAQDTKEKKCQGCWYNKDGSKLRCEYHINKDKLETEKHFLQSKVIKDIHKKGMHEQYKKSYEEKNWLMCEILWELAGNGFYKY